MPKLVCRDCQPESNYQETIMHTDFFQLETHCKLYSLESTSSNLCNCNWQLHEIHNSIFKMIYYCFQNMYHKYLRRHSYILQSIFIDQLQYTIKNEAWTRKYLIRMAHKLFVYILLPAACYVWDLSEGLWLVPIPFPFWADQSQTQIQIVHCLSNSCYCSKLTLISYPY